MSEHIEFNPFQGNPGEFEILRDNNDIKEGKSEFDEYLNKNILTAMLLFLNQLKSTDTRSYNPKNITFRRAELESCKDEDIYTRINDSDKNVWKEHPSYYHALIAEIKSRNLI